MNNRILRKGAWSGLQPHSATMSLRPEAAEAIIADETRLSHDILEQAGVGVVLCNLEGRVVRCNGIARRFAGDDAVGQPFDSVLPLRDETGQDIGLESLLATAGIPEAVLERQSRRAFLSVGAGPWRRACGEHLGAVVTVTDITPLKAAKAASLEVESELQVQLQRAERGRRSLLSLVEDQQEAMTRINWLAHYDGLTGLPNRTLLDQRLREEIGRAKQNGTQLALLNIDLDHFKNINDALGQGIGDRLLVEMGARLADAVGEEGIVARQGGDEFLVLLPGRDGEDAMNIAGTLLQMVRDPVRFGEHELMISASIGIAVHPYDAEEVDVLYRHSDLAMFRSKRSGRNGISLFTASMQRFTARTLRLDNDIREAALRGELELHYQPQVALADGRIRGLEALLRWRHPKLGMISPGEFIPIAENGGHILEIGEWVLGSAARQYSRWKAAGIEPPRIAINLSMRQLRQPNLLNRFERIMLENGAEPHCFELELTESMLLEEREVVIDLLNSMHALGFQLAIDDFGTGYSSLSYLKRLPMDRLKVDKSFVNDMLDSREDAIIVRSVISLGHNLGMSVIAEGVEQVEQVEFLREHRCDDVQGYLYAKPVPAGEVERLLTTDRPWSPGNKPVDPKKERTLLVVDGDPDSLAATRRAVEGCGYKVLPAQSGAEALEILARHRVGVIVSEQRLNGMSGIELFDTTKEQYPDCMRIMLTDCSDAKTIAEAINRGDVFKFLSKPWERETLLESIQDGFRRFALAVESRQLLACTLG